MSALPIADHALLSDRHSAALVLEARTFMHDPVVVVWDALVHSRVVAIE